MQGVNPWWESGGWKLTRGRWNCLSPRWFCIASGKTCRAGV